MTKKSLNDEIRSIVGGQVNEDNTSLTPTDNDPSPKKRTANMATLAPGSKFKEEKKAPLGKVVDLGGDTPTVIAKNNPDATTGMSKDTSKSSKSQVGPEPRHSLKEDEDFITEDDLIEYANQLAEEGLDEDQIAEAIDTILQDYEEVLSEDTEGDDDETEEDDEDDEDDDQDDEEIEYPELDLDVDLTDDIEALVQGEELSEEFKDKAKLIFETVIKARLTEYQEKLDETFKLSLNQAVTQVETQLSENVEKYIDYVVENWVDDNEVAIETGLRTELTEEFIQGFLNLCREHYIDVPEEKMDIIEELSERVSDLEGQLNEEIETNVELTSIISEAKKEVAFYELTEGLADTQVEKLKDLAEGIAYTSDDDFSNAVLTLRENYFPEYLVVNRDVQNDDGLLVEEVVASPTIDRYSRFLGTKQ